MGIQADIEEEIMNWGHKSLQHRLWNQDGNNTKSKDEWRTCPECKDPLGKWDTVAKDNVHCRHCYTKLKHGVSDLETCFKGSVITID